ncbi:MAG: 50S ribosomal protein L6 [Phycisphaerales bacterium]
MSRIGKKPVALAKDVTVTVANRAITVKGKLGTLSYTHRPEVEVKVDGGNVVVTRSSDAKQVKAYHGLTRALVNNMIKGVSEGFKKELEVNGVGWTAKVQGKKIVLTVGYADPRELPIPADVKVEVNQNKITVSGCDRQAVGQMAANIRAQRPPEPYNHKGIKYADEILIKKEGKAFAGGGS